MPSLDSQQSYRRGLLAMYLMRSYIGEDAVASALRRLFERHRAGALRHATVRDVVGELRTVTPDSMRYLITDLETATVWNTRTEQIVVEPAGNGEYRVMLDVVATKQRPGSAGEETEVPMDDIVDIGDIGAISSGQSEPLYMKQHRIRGGRTITFTLPKAPLRVEIDPYCKLLERFGRNNAKVIAAIR